MFTAGTTGPISPPFSVMKSRLPSMIIDNAAGSPPAR